MLLGLQLLAYLSKYPHVRQAFYKPRVTFHPATVNLGGRNGAAVAGKSGVAGKGILSSSATATSRGVSAIPTPVKESHGFFRAFATATGRGKEKEKEKEAS